MFFLFVHHKLFTLSHTVLIPDTNCTQVLVFAQKKRAKLRTVQPEIKNQEEYAFKKEAGLQCWVATHPTTSYYNVRTLYI